MNKKRESMNLLYKLMLLSLFLTSVKLALAASEQGFSPHITVRIFNKMKNGSNFTVHCKSGDDDLGTHVLEVGKPPYEWSFHVNVWGTTLFYCNSYWKGKHIGFNAYHANRDIQRCPRTCVWKGYEDGLFGFIEWPPVADLHYVWE